MKLIDFHPHPIVELPSTGVLQLDLSVSNAELTQLDFPTLADFDAWLANTLRSAGHSIAAGGYNEHRKWYQRHPEHFGSGDNARCIHLGIDVWAAAGTPIYAPFNGRVHSFANNAGEGNYGPTVTLEHELAGQRLFSLFGHLATQSLALWEAGKAFQRGEIIGYLGKPAENGGWAPHVHCQLMLDMEGWKGDYPGVCTLADRERFIANCPDPGALVFPA